MARPSPIPYFQVRSRNDKLENHLAEAIEKIKSYHLVGAGAGPTPAGGPGGAVATLGAGQLEDLHKEAEEQRELANNRLVELDRLHQQHRETLKEVEKLKMDASTLSYHITTSQCLSDLFRPLQFPTS